MLNCPRCGVIIYHDCMTKSGVFTDSDTPFGHVPILDFGDARIAQTPSILRFVAKLAGMDGAEEGNTAAAMVDMTADAASDFLLCEWENTRAVLIRQNQKESILDNLQTELITLKVPKTAEESES